VKWKVTEETKTFNIKEMLEAVNKLSSGITMDDEVRVTRKGDDFVVKRIRKNISNL